MGRNEIREFIERLLFYCPPRGSFPSEKCTSTIHTLFWRYFAFGPRKLREAKSHSSIGFSECASGTHLMLRTRLRGAPSRNRILLLALSEPPHFLDLTVPRPCSFVLVQAASVGRFIAGRKLLFSWVLRAGTWTGDVIFSGGRGAKKIYGAPEKSPSNSGDAVTGPRAV